MRERSLDIPSVRLEQALGGFSSSACDLFACGNQLEHRISILMLINEHDEASRI